MINTVYLTPKELDNFLNMFKNVTCVECVEGCLVDSALYTVGGEGCYGTIAVYEHYLNSWASDLEVRFALVDSDDAEFLEEQFNEVFSKEIYGEDDEDDEIAI